MNRDRVVIGIDQSYAGTGISIFRNGQFVKLMCMGRERGKSNTDFRRMLEDFLSDELNYYLIENDVKIVCERIRLKSQGHLSQQYILSTAALMSTIIDVADAYEVKTYDVDTRAWKKAIVGTSKKQSNRYGIAPEKYPTILYLKHIGLLGEIVEPYEGRGKKGVIIVNMNGQKVPCKMNDNKADAYCIGLFGVRYPERLKEVVF